MQPILVGDILERAERLYGGRVAIVDGETRYTYAEAGQRIRRLAAGLLGLGLPVGAHIAILANNSHRYYETYFAAHYAGMPLAPLNIRLAGEELAFIIRDGDVRALLVGPEYLPLLAEFRDRLPDLRHVIVLDDTAPAGDHTYESLIEGSAPLDAAARDWAEDDLINLCYTGGTTGRPKGVMLTQRNVVSNAEHVQMTFPVDEDDVWLHVAPLFHLADAWACYVMTMAGATQVCVPGFTPDGFLEAVQAEGVTATILVPTMINFVVNHPQVRDYDVSSLRLILFGASPMAVDRIQAAREIFGPVLCQAYGMTETAPVLTAQRLAWLDYDTPEGIERLASCGREVMGVRLRIVDAAGADVPPGGVGEIVVRGPNVMAGYWKRPQETAEALRDGWMHTGDIARMDADGFVYIVDRAKDMIISGGENVFTTEVENALYEHPAVLEAAVIGIPSERWGEAVHAIVVLRPGETASEADLVSFCHGKIAGYKCPKSVDFRTEPLPKSGPGKILKTELRKPFWAGQDTAVH
ncbi:MAG: long-chain-fatty-acid--CoA ligase [Chloroflexota bacterium]|nr:long-chain-fatty-acid--CoA ligase [Chloroflexota bacterium]